MLIWSGVLGGTPARLDETDGRRVLTVGVRRTVIRPDTIVRHRGGVLFQRLTVSTPGEPGLTHRYRLPWLLQLAPFREATYDRWAAEADDPGLRLTELLGGTDDWEPSSGSVR
ncbi:MULTISPECIES: hypothetical protein [unclassified Streptomyces]|uniref:hypothetical protein n=1 Tax=unclassified Streptomyces TaxID=2593676 RepID=UPI003D735A29